MDSPVARPLKIVIIRNADAHDFGGGERMPVNLAACLIGVGFESIVVSRSAKLLAYAHSQKVPAIRGWWWSRQNWSGARVLLTPIYFAWELVLFCWYLTLFIKLRPKIVHAQSKDDFIAATLAAKLLGKKVIWSDHADLKYLYLNLGVWYKNPMGKAVWYCSRFASSIILTSQEDQRQIAIAASRKLPNRYQVIYNGISDKPELLNYQGDSKKVIFSATSRLVTAKGIGELIEAFNSVSAKVPAELWLLGEGPEEDKFRVMAKGNKAIKFLGFPKNALNYVAEADVFVHPSYLEGFSISLLEAAMLGKPIIACPVGGNTELISDKKNGLLVPAHDAAALADSMLVLAEDKALRKSLGDAARSTYEKRFVFEKIVKEIYVPLYEKL